MKLRLNHNDGLKGKGVDPFHNDVISFEILPGTSHASVMNRNINRNRIEHHLPQL